MMKLRKIYSTWMPPKGYKAITLLFLVVIRKDARFTDVDYNHENIHLAQEMELLFIGFYLWYGIEYLIRLMMYRSHNDAYRNISFEQEAYMYQYDMEYLDTRSHFTWLRYLTKKTFRR